MTSANTFRTVDIEGVGIVELVCVGGLLRIGCQYFILSVWCGDLLEVGLLVKGSWM